MTDNLYIQYETGDTGTRSPTNPLPPGTDFWSSPGIFLDTSSQSSAIDQSTYVPNGKEQGIWVVVQDKSSPDKQVPYVFVEVWLCNPATIAGPDSALKVSDSPSAPTYLTGNSASEGFATPIELGGFYPSPGLTTVNHGHVCLIANCYGSLHSSGSPISEGQSLIGMTTADFAGLVLSDAHVAQHNIFAAAVTMLRHLTFPFNAVAAVPKGGEKVILEIENVKEGDAGLTTSDLSFLHKGPYRNLPLHASKVPLKAFAIDGGPRGPAEHVPLEVHAGHPVQLSILVEVGPGERVGGVHTLNVIQKTVSGHVQGGIRLLAVVT
jgi:hypothetical protein